MYSLRQLELARRSVGMSNAACLIAALIAFSPLPAAAAGCATPAELVAAAVRILQIDLQVIALQCAAVPGSTRALDYNAFVLRNRPSLLLATRILQEHYRRTSGIDPEASLDAFETLAANLASLRHLDEPALCLADSAVAHAYALGMQELEAEAARLEGGQVGVFGTACATAAVR